MRFREVLKFSVPPVMIAAGAVGVFGFNHYQNEVNTQAYAAAVRIIGQRPPSGAEVFNANKVIRRSTQAGILNLRDGRFDVASSQLQEQLPRIHSAQRVLAAENHFENVFISARDSRFNALMGGGELAGSIFGVGYGVIRLVDAGILIAMKKNSEEGV